MVYSKNMEEIVDRGWSVVELDSRAIIADIQVLLLERLREKWFPEIERLELYHKSSNNGTHTDIQYDLSNFLNSSGLIKALVNKNIGLLQAVSGNDLHIQKYPYLRIARPGVKEDNIGVHRDTYYGCSVYEVSMHIPIIDLPASASLGVISGSHIAKESDYPWTQTKATDVEKGSKKHQLGFLYSPKVMNLSVSEKMEYHEIKAGQALLFPLSLVHGQEVNSSEITRFSVDIRFVNSYAPIQWERNVHGDYYEKLCESTISKLACFYNSANKDL